MNIPDINDLYCFEFDGAAILLRFFDGAVWLNVQTIPCPRWDATSRQLHPWQYGKFGLELAKAILAKHFSTRRGRAEAENLAALWAKEFWTTFLKRQDFAQPIIQHGDVTAWIVDCLLDDLTEVRRSLARAIRISKN